jgi:hypothetical protein
MTLQLKNPLRLLNFQCGALFSRAALETLGRRSVV